MARSQKKYKLPQDPVPPRASIARFSFGWPAEPADGRRGGEASEGEAAVAVVEKPVAVLKKRVARKRLTTRKRPASAMSKSVDDEEAEKDKLWREIMGSQDDPVMLSGSESAEGDAAAGPSSGELAAPDIGKPAASEEGGEAALPPEEKAGASGSDVSASTGHMDRPPAVLANVSQQLMPILPQADAVPLCIKCGQEVDVLQKGVWFMSKCSMYQCQTCCVKHVGIIRAFGSSKFEELLLASP